MSGKTVDVVFNGKPMRITLETLPTSSVVDDVRGVFDIARRAEASGLYKRKKPTTSTPKKPPKPDVTKKRAAANRDLNQAKKQLKSLSNKVDKLLAAKKTIEKKPKQPKKTPEKKKEKKETKVKKVKKVKPETKRE